MKAQVNKSKLMKRAWNIYKGNNPYSYSFSAALRRAWAVEKEYLEYNERKAEDKKLPGFGSYAFSEAFGGITAYYRTARPGQYFGD